MVIGEVKSKIDSLWEMLWTEGSTNPLTNIEQLSYLLFMKDLDNLELAREADSNILGLQHEGIFPAINLNIVGIFSKISVMLKKFMLSCNRKFFLL